MRGPESHGRLPCAQASRESASHEAARGPGAAARPEGGAGMPGSTLCLRRGSAGRKTEFTSAQSRQTKNNQMLEKS